MPARRFRRRPPAYYYVLAAIALLVAARAGWEAVDTGRDREVLEGVASARGALAPGPCEVVRVVDGDTLILRQPAAASARNSPAAGELNSSAQYRVRLLGIDTPETVKEGTAVQPWGPQATSFSREFVRRGSVTVELDKRRLDRFGRSLAYVYVGDELLNVELVRAGLARVSSYPGDSQAMLKRLRDAETEARLEERGIWSERGNGSRGNGMN